jgi:GMP reductase
MRIEDEIKLDYKDVLIRPKRSTLKSRKEVDLYRKYKFRNSRRNWYGVPIMAANMDGVGTFPMATELTKEAMITCITKQHEYNEWENHHVPDNETVNNIIKQHVAISIGTSEEGWQRAKKTIKDFNLYWICIDIANGYSEHFADFVKKVRSEFPYCNIIAGNVVTADMTQELILAGADVVKVGIGPGSVCTTRIQTGVGYPQLSAVIECADAAHGLGGHIIADGGCTCPGDVAKAFAAGADFVMLGGMLAGHDEGGGEVITKRFKTNERDVYDDGDTGDAIFDEKRYVSFYGMSSDTAMNKHSGGVAEYRSSEGRTVEVPYKGPIKETVKDILGGLRSTCTYVGAPTLKQLSKCTTFIRCTQQFNSVFAR